MRIVHFFTFVMVAAGAAGQAWAQVAEPVPPTATTLPVDASAADSALLLPLLAALEAAPAARAADFEAVAKVGDKRAIAALRYAAVHDNVAAVADAATAWLGKFADPRAIAALREIALGAESARPSQAALDALSASPLPAGVDTLYALAADADVDMAIRRNAAEVLQRDHPKVLAERGSPALGGSSLTATLGGGYFGGFALASVGQFANSGSAALGWVAGSIIGAGTGFIFGRQVSDARQHYYISAAGWGAFAGTIAANALVNRPFRGETFQRWDGQEFVVQRERVSKEEVGLDRWEAGLSLAGEVGGLALAALAADSLNFKSTDVLTADLTGIATTVATAGFLGLLKEADDSRPGYAALLTGSLLGIGVGVAAAPHLHFDSGDLALTAYAMGEGMWSGGFLVSAFHSGTTEPYNVMLGGGLGLLAGGALAQYSELKPGNVGEMLVLSSYGKMLGAGLSFFADGDFKQNTLAMVAGSAAGVAAAVYLADTTSYQHGDVALVPISTLLGLWHGSLIGSLVQNADWSGSHRDNMYAGFALTTTAVFGLGGAIWSQNSDLSNWQVTMGSTGAVWGAWFGGWTLALDNHASETNSAGRMLLFTDLGLATTAVLVSPLADVDPRIIGGANFGGMACAGLAALFTAMASRDSDQIIRANLIGSAVGLVAGGVLAKMALGDAKPMTKSSQWQLPAWLRLPVQSVHAAPHIDSVGRFDGMTLQAVLGFAKN